MLGSVRALVQNACGVCRLSHRLGGLKRKAPCFVASGQTARNVTNGATPSLVAECVLLGKFRGAQRNYFSRVSTPGRLSLQRCRKILSFENGVENTTSCGSWSLFLVCKQPLKFLSLPRCDFSKSSSRSTTTNRTRPREV